jgi:hypothetical protein
MSEKSIHDQLGSFDGGMNSGVDPLKLKPSVMAYALNGTVRGDFFKTRPPFRQITLIFSNTPWYAAATGYGPQYGYTAAQCQTNFQTSSALFQGACYYVPDTVVNGQTLAEGGNGTIVLAVGGYLFQITPDSLGNATVWQVDNNGTTECLLNASAPICWLRQAEAWVIANDGSGNPIFYNQSPPAIEAANGGSEQVFIRRSIGNVQLYIGQTTGNSASTAVNTAPAIGSNALFTVQPPTQSPYGPYVSNFVGQTILIGEQLYLLISYETSDNLAGYFPVSLSMLTETIPGGDELLPNTTFFANTNVVGFITSSSNSTFPSNTSPTNQITITCHNVQIQESGNPSAGDNFYIHNYPSLQGTLTSGTIASVTVVSNTDGTVVFTIVLNITNYPNPIAGNPVPATGTTSMRWNSYAGDYVITSYNSTTVWPTITPPQFTLQMGSLQVASLTSLVGFTLSVGQSPNVSTFLVLSVSGGMLVCQTVTGVGNTIPLNPESPSAGTLAELVTISLNTNGTPFSNSQSPIITYPMLDNTGADNTPVTLSSTPSPNISVIAATPSPTLNQVVSMTSSESNTYYFILEGIGSGTSGESGNFIYVQNLNDTPGNVISNGTPIQTIPELPPGRMLAYGMGRVWEALPDGRHYMAGDIVNGASGSSLYQGRDAVLKVSENDMLAGGGSFVVPGNTGNIQGMAFVPVLDASLGQGPLQVGTNRQIFSCNAPVQREQWATLTNPIQTVSLLEAGFIAADCITPASGDLLFRSSDGQLRSLLMARLDFDRWGNTPVSREMATLIEGENDLLMQYCSGVNFDNRWLVTANPTQTIRGVYWTSLVALNFDPYSSMAEKKPAVYDGEWQGLNILKLINGDQFSGGPRCFALCLDSTLQNLTLSEILPSDDPNSQLFNDNGVNPITSYFESPSMFDESRDEGRETYKRLTYGEIYIDELQSNVNFQIYYLSDQWPDWVPWTTFLVNYGPKNGAADPGFRPRIGLPKPDMTACDPHNLRPLCEGYTFQVKIVATGYFRFLGARFQCEEISQSQYKPPICNETFAPIVIGPTGIGILFSGPSANPNGICRPGNGSSVAFYYQDGPSVNLWFWSKNSQSWVAIVSDQSPAVGSSFFTQGGQVIVGGLASPINAPIISTQPALYYEDSQTIQLWGWSVSSQQWLPLITGGGSNVTIPVVLPQGTMYRATTSDPTTTPNPRNAGALWVEDSPNIQFYAWSVINQTWFGIIAS